MAVYDLSFMNVDGLSLVPTGHDAETFGGHVNSSAHAHFLVAHIRRQNSQGHEVQRKADEEVPLTQRIPH